MENEVGCTSVAKNAVVGTSVVDNEVALIFNVIQIGVQVPIIAPKGPKGTKTQEPTPLC